MPLSVCTQTAMIGAPQRPQRVSEDSLTVPGVLKEVTCRVLPQQIAMYRDRECKLPSVPRGAAAFCEPWLGGGPAMSRRFLEPFDDVGEVNQHARRDAASAPITDALAMPRLLSHAE